MGAFATAFAFSENAQAADAETATMARKRRMTTPVVSSKEKCNGNNRAKGAGDD
jgi:hypothetical protein